MAHEPTHVLHVTFDMRIGGTEQVIRNLVEAADPGDLNMSIFCIEEPLGPWGRSLLDSGTPVSSVARRAGFDPAVVRALRRHLRTRPVDVVHCHQYTPWVYGSLAALGLGKTVVFTEHGRFHPDRASPKRRFINPLLARSTDHLTAISEATRQALADHEYLRAADIRVIYNGIAGLTPHAEAAAAVRRKLGIAADAPVLGTIARFDPIKNHPMALRAFRKVLDRHPQARFLLVGDGEERPNIEREIARLSLQSAVILPGYIPEPAHWLGAMDLFLLTSFSEGTSMTLLEAMSLGKACIATAVGGNPEIVADGETGYLVPSDDPAALAGRILELLDDPDRLGSFSRNAAARFAAQFTSGSMLARYRELYADRRAAPG